MRETLLTRKDDGLGEGLFDSIAWAFSEHVKTPDTGLYNAAILLHGGRTTGNKHRSLSVGSPTGGTVTCHRHRPLRKCP